MDHSNREQSDFNFAITFLTRLNYALVMCMEGSISYDMERWWQGLDILYRELSDDMKEDEIKKLETELKEIEPEVTQFIKNRNNGSENEITPQTYHKLRDIEMTLRKIIRAAGYKTRMKDDYRGGSLA